MSENEIKEIPEKQQVSSNWFICVSILSGVIFHVSFLFFTSLLDDVIKATIEALIVFFNPFSLLFLMFLPVIGAILYIFTPFVLSFFILEYLLKLMNIEVDWSDWEIEE